MPETNHLAGAGRAGHTRANADRDACKLAVMELALSGVQPGSKSRPSSPTAAMIACAQRLRQSVPHHMLQGRPTL